MNLMHGIKRPPPAEGGAARPVKPAFAGNETAVGKQFFPPARLVGGEFCTGWLTERKKEELRIKKGKGNNGVPESLSNCETGFSLVLTTPDKGYINPKPGL